LFFIHGGRRKILGVFEHLFMGNFYHFIKSLSMPFRRLPQACGRLSHFVGGLFILKGGIFRLMIYQSMIG
ncbi:MAG: hypothetical protein LBQ65_07815, partial [Tannerellaceae bacterium]|nr:hypothetical protein [Tannerellaceae bacterium]